MANCKRRFVRRTVGLIIASFAVASTVSAHCPDEFTLPTEALDEIDTDQLMTDTNSAANVVAALALPTERFRLIEEPGRLNALIENFNVVVLNWKRLSDHNDEMALFFMVKYIACSLHELDP